MHLQWDTDALSDPQAQAKNFITHKGLFTICELFGFACIMSDLIHYK